MAQTEHAPDQKYNVHVGSQQHPACLLQFPLSLQYSCDSAASRS